MGGVFSGMVAAVARDALNMKSGGETTNPQVLITGLLYELSGSTVPMFIDLKAINRDYSPFQCS